MDKTNLKLMPIEDVVKLFNYGCIRPCVECPCYGMKECDDQLYSESYYLNHYKELSEHIDKTEKRYHDVVTELSNIKDKEFIDSTFPLTWDELTRMEGQPVWLEYDNNGIETLSHPIGWVIIDVVNTSTTLPEINFVSKWQTFWMSRGTMDKHWNAYRKEKKDE